MPSYTQPLLTHEPTINAPSLISRPALPPAPEIETLEHELEPLGLVRVVAAILLVAVRQERESVRRDAHGQVGEPNELGILGQRGSDDGHEGGAQEGNVQSLLLESLGTARPEGRDDEEPPPPESEDFDGYVQVVRAVPIEPPEQRRGVRHHHPTQTQAQHGLPEENVLKPPPKDRPPFDEQTFLLLVDGLPNRFGLLPSTSSVALLGAPSFNVEIGTLPRKEHQLRSQIEKIPFEVDHLGRVEQFVQSHPEIGLYRFVNPLHERIVRAHLGVLEGGGPSHRRQRLVGLLPGFRQDASPSLGGGRRGRRPIRGTLRRFLGRGCEEGLAAAFAPVGRGPEAEGGSGRGAG
mmetsp:Transcript_9263/g.27922  ORF Transcript_9263/g.27922 Transcript_9263/m.27922 type:complete len:349 (+) Transcript_9263:170-1216(+)